MISAHWGTTVARPRGPIHYFLPNDERSVALDFMRDCIRRADQSESCRISLDARTQPVSNACSGEPRKVYGR